MKSIEPVSFTPRVNARLTTYATLAGVALAAPALAPSAQAAVITNNINLAVPSTIDGFYLNFATGGTSASGDALAGWDWNPYLTNSVLTFFWNNTAPSVSSGVATAVTGGTYLSLAPGTVVNAASIFSASSGSGGAGSTIAYQGTGTETLGFRFYNEATAAIDYGYATIKTTATSGFPATVLSYSYENTGAAITVVPEPTTTALLGLGALALGASGVRRWRQAGQAVA